MSFSKPELDELLEAMRMAADEAGALLLEGLNRPKHIEYKGVVDLVTEYDTRAEELITRKLADQFPKISILAEESSLDNDSEAVTRFIVDPLDGTTNFSHGQPIFAVSIGLEDDGDLVAGVVNMPALGLEAWARSGGGALCNGERIRVSENHDLGHCLVATGFPYDRRTAQDDNTREFNTFIKHTQGVRRCGGNFSKIGGESTDLLRLGTSCDKYGQLWDLIFVTDTIIYVFPK
ncbi:MAG: inositol monophosphatase [Deltaproteobacteria bacterium]|nr:inositol monophosphatase [Deltaproteobacteria bacterium]